LEQHSLGRVAARGFTRVAIQGVVMFAKTHVLFASLLFTAVLAPGAAADGFGVAFGKKGAHVSLAFGFGAPVCFAPAPCAPSVWVPGHYETVLETVWIEETRSRMWCAAIVEHRRDACGRVFEVVVAPAHWKFACVPAHDETRRVSVWRPAHWEARF
jgi:hypothetical protein